MPNRLIKHTDVTETQPGSIHEPLLTTLQISELFVDTIQGEGRTVGFPAIFLRLTGCTLDCTWCDTSEVWRIGNHYLFREIFSLLEKSGAIDKLKIGHHLVITGGSPLKQQDKLVKFIELFIVQYGFKPYIEIENECVLMPSRSLICIVDQWNNSPKLSNSGMKERSRYKPEVLYLHSMLPNSWFKFVVSSETDWYEIQRDFIDTRYVTPDQVILMPEGCTQEELNRNREMVVELCVKHSVLFSDRLHVTIWNQKTGV